MIPYPYNMVDMGGIDLAEANGTVVEGLYAKIVEAVNACGDVVLYNWKFAGIEISPQHTSILMGDPIIISGAVQVTAQDEVTVPGINPEPPPPPTIIPLSVTENGTFSAEDYDADGFDPVSVALPPPILVGLEVNTNGEYLPSGDAVGFNSVTVNVDTPPSSEYQEVEPDFFGLATAYQGAIGQFAVISTKTQCLFIAEIHSGYKYVVFLPETYGNRFRVGVWPGKAFSDFEPYLDSPSSEETIYTGCTMVTPYGSDLSGDALKQRIYFNGANGEVLIGTSSQASLIKPVLFKIEEVQ